MSDFTGTSGGDSLAGASGDDLFDMTQGGDDTVAAGGGNDQVDMGSTLTAADQLDGGDGVEDILRISGSYATKLVFAATTMTGFEELQLGAGGSYNLVLDDGNVAAGEQLIVGADFLGAGDALRFNGAHETDGHFLVNFGLGRAKVALGDGGDTFNLYTGVLNPADRLNGGAGNDRIILSGASQTDYVFGSHTMRNVEVLQLANAFAFDITFADANIAKHVIFVVDATAAASVAFHDSAETNGALSITSSGGSDLVELGAGDDSVFANAGDDTLSGGEGKDSLDGGEGHDLITGGAGMDRLTGGADADTFVFTAAADSTKAASDLITDLEDTDTIGLSAIDADVNTSGDQPFTLVGHFSGHAGELVLKFASGPGITLLEGDVDGDGKADFVVSLNGDHSGFTNFVL